MIMDRTNIVYVSLKMSILGASTAFSSPEHELLILHESFILIMIRIRSSTLLQRTDTLFRRSYLRRKRGTNDPHSETRKDLSA